MSLITECFSRVRSGTPPFSRLIAYDLYDGPMSGLVECTGGGEWYWFLLLAWDENQHDRAFSLAPVDGKLVQEMISRLAKLDDPSWPEWWLNASGSSEKLDAMATVFADVKHNAARELCVVVSSALLEDLKSWSCIRTEEQRRAFLQLSRRTPADSELTDAPFDAWLHFVNSTEWTAL
jgi:hypothetical protein